MTLAEEKRIIAKTSVWTLIFNAFLAGIKICAGIIGHSGAIISDAINSLSDVVSNLTVMIVGKFSRKEKDARHPYGHEKFDSMVSVIVGIFIMVTAFEILKDASFRLYDHFVYQKTIPEPGLFALIVALATIVIKGVMYRLTIKGSKNAKSQALAAIAMDNRSDAFASLGAAIGIGGAMLGVRFLEPAASIVISLFIARLGYRIIKEGFGQVVDQAAPDDEIEKIRAIVSSVAGVVRIDDLKTRMFGMKLYVDIEIAVSSAITLSKAHAISHLVHDAIEDGMPEVKHCMVHVNPDDVQ